MSNFKFSLALRFTLGLPLVYPNFAKCTCDRIGITLELHISSCPTFSKTHRHMGPLLTLRQICNSAGLPNTYETPVDADVIIDVERKGSEHVMDAIITVPMEEERNIYKNADVMVIILPCLRQTKRRMAASELFVGGNTDPESIPTQPFPYASNCMLLRVD